MGTEWGNREIETWGNKYIPKYNKNAILNFHSLAFYTSLQKEQRNTSNIIWILELPLDYSHGSKRVRWAGEAMPLNGKNEQGNVVTLKLQDFGCSELIAWMLFLWKGFLRHSFITKMLTKLKPQEQARKLEMFTHSKAYKNNPFPFSGQKCRELQQCTLPCQGTWGFADQKGAKPAQGTGRQQVLHYQCVIVWWLLTSDS